MLTSEGMQFYKRLNKLFLSLSKTNLEALVEIIKERPSDEQETIILEIADRLTKYSNIRYSISKEKNNLRASTLFHYKISNFSEKKKIFCIAFFRILLKIIPILV